MDELIGCTTTTKTIELYDIYSKSTHKRITEEKEDVYWDDWVIAWMPLPEPYRAERRTDE